MLFGCGDESSRNFGGVSNSREDPGSMTQL
jgi:hypothetical protein